MTDPVYFLFPLVYIALNAVSLPSTGWINTKQERKMAHFGTEPVDSCIFRSNRRVAWNGTVQAQDAETPVQVLRACVYWSSPSTGSLDKPGLNIKVS